LSVSPNSFEESIKTIKKLIMMVDNLQNMGITASFTSSANDFDFLQGNWKVKNRKLLTRLNNCQEWTEFDSEIKMRKVPGIGNVENFTACINEIPFEGMAIRLYHPTTKLWTIYWIDSNHPAMDKNPVTGSFENGVGKFYTNDQFNGQEIIMLYQWDATNPLQPVWSQAFSPDNGKTWEWNWEMKLSK
jgi:hypothetical protein